jgi:hypothetical protein
MGESKFIKDPDSHVGAFQGKNQLLRTVHSLKADF